MRLMVMIAIGSQTHLTRVFFLNLSPASLLARTRLFGCEDLQTTVPEVRKVSEMAHEGGTGKHSVFGRVS